jgi:hypothetical protein
VKRFIVTTILVAADPETSSDDLEAFYCIEGSDDPVAEIIEYANLQKKGLEEITPINNLHACLVVREPDSAITLSTWISPAFKLDYEGKVEDLPIIRFLKLLQRQNIDLYISQGTPWTGRAAPVPEPPRDVWEKRMKHLILDGFSFRIEKWLTKSWGVPFSGF